jgi:hypothetical protein
VCGKVCSEQFTFFAFYGLLPRYLKKEKTHVHLGQQKVKKPLIFAVSGFFDYKF